MDNGRVCQRRKVAIYYRVSTTLQASRNLGEFREVASRNNWLIDPELVDQGFSATAVRLESLSRLRLRGIVDDAALNSAGAFTRLHQAATLAWDLFRAVLHGNDFIAQAS